MEYKPTYASKTWRKASLTMRAEAYEMMKADAPKIAEQEGRFDWRIVTED